MAAPQVINSPAERPLAEWQHLYPDLWRLLEVTAEEDGALRHGRLIAVDPDDVNFVSLWQKAMRQDKVTAILHGVYTAAGPMVVA